MRSEFLLRDMPLYIRMGALEIKVAAFTRVYPHPDWHTTLHSHADFEIHIIPSGKGKIEIEGNAFTVRGGDFYVTGPYVKHRQITDPQDPMAEYCLECEIRALPGHPLPAQEAEEVKNALAGVYPAPFPGTEAVSLAEEIMQEDEARQAGYILRVQNKIAALVLHLARVITGGQESPSLPFSRQAADDARIARITGYVKANYALDIRLEDVSKALFLSARQVNRLMAKYFSQSFHAYLAAYRLTRARALLESGNLSIEGVAYAAGYRSHYYMYQAFKRAGLPPPGVLRTQSTR